MFRVHQVYNYTNKEQTYKSIANTEKRILKTPKQDLEMEERALLLAPISKSSVVHKMQLYEST